MSTQTRVYFASKLHHAPQALTLIRDWPGIHFTARWPLMHGVIPDDSSMAHQFWQDDFDDIARADIVLAWAKPDDKLRGALVEVGIGIGLGKKIVLGGEHPDFGTWQFHPSVVRMSNMTAALDFCRNFRRTTG